MAATVHLIKLCVGVETFAEQAEWQAGRVAEAERTGDDPRPVHVTRMWPTRADELLAGGSLYWVIKGLVLARQRIVAFEPRTGEDGITRCAIRFDPDLVRTVPVPRRPFQGWRYLRAEDAPRDLSAATPEDMPTQLMAGLAEIGVV